MHCLYTGPAKGSMGSERVVESLTKALVSLNHDVVMVANMNSDQSKMPAKILEEIPEGYDIVHGQGHGGDVLGKHNKNMTDSSLFSF